jgi:hypothetical protein
VELYFHSTIRLLGVVPWRGAQLSTGKDIFTIEIARIGHTGNGFFNQIYLNVSEINDGAYYATVYKCSFVKLR